MKNKIYKYSCTLNKNTDMTDYIHKYTFTLKTNTNIKDQIKIYERSQYNHMSQINTDVKYKYRYDKGKAQCVCKTDIFVSGESLLFHVETDTAFNSKPLLETIASAWILLLYFGIQHFHPPCHSPY